MNDTKEMLGRKIDTCKVELEYKVDDLTEIADESMERATDLALGVVSDSKNEFVKAGDTAQEGVKDAVDDSVNELEMALEKARERLEEAV